MYIKIKYLFNKGYRIDNLKYNILIYCKSDIKSTNKFKQFLMLIQKCVNENGIFENDWI